MSGVIPRAGDWVQLINHRPDRFNQVGQVQSVKADGLLHMGGARHWAADAVRVVTEQTAKELIRANIARRKSVGDDTPPPLAGWDLVWSQRYTAIVAAMAPDYAEDAQPLDLKKRRALAFHVSELAALLATEAHRFEMRRASRRRGLLEGHEPDEDA